MLRTTALWQSLGSQMLGFGPLDRPRDECQACGYLLPVRWSFTLYHSLCAKPDVSTALPTKPASHRGRVLRSAHRPQPTTFQDSADHSTWVCVPRDLSHVGDTFYLGGLY